VYNQYNSDGSCQVKCQDTYAFAILLGSDCWCSDYAPSNQKQTDLCDDPCPGYQSDWCGSTSAGLYGYIALSISPSGTIGGAASSPQTSSSIASSSVSTTPSTPRYQTPSFLSTYTSFAVETAPTSAASITTLTSVVSVQSSVQASSSTVETSSAVIVPASSATTSSTTV
jgi:cell wall integrity and stress response component